VTCPGEIVVVGVVTLEGGKGRVATTEGGRVAWGGEGKGEEGCAEGVGAVEMGLGMCWGRRLR
jgi:hypothetical protein